MVDSIARAKYNNYLKFVVPVLCQIDLIMGMYPSLMHTVVFYHRQILSIYGEHVELLWVQYVEIYVTLSGYTPV